MLGNSPSMPVDTKHSCMQRGLGPSSCDRLHAGGGRLGLGSFDELHREADAGTADAALQVPGSEECLPEARADFPVP